jgi:aminoglycoside phosphotransferase (APT) family kinase protein
MSTALLPDVHMLTRGLSSVLRAQWSPGAQVTIVQREPTNEGTFPSEIVTCQRDDGAAMQMLCKYTAGHSHDAYGHRGGVAYEANVYRHVLQPLAVSTPALYGTHTDERTGETWLVLEYVNASLRLEHAPNPAGVVMAARWIGRFHAANEARLSSAPLPFLNTYDAAYYQGWVRRTALFAEPVRPYLPWLMPLCERSQVALALLLAPPVTIIHGEYYPKNVLYREGIIYPVDWESAAIAAGEIDLACLTDRWPADTVRECERAYQQARWPHGAPVDFAQRLAAARLYMHFRWLGDRPEWTTRQHYWRFEHLRSVGQQLGLI